MSDCLTTVTHLMVIEHGTLDTDDLFDTAHGLDFDADELTLLQVTEATSRSIAAKTPPSSQRGIAA